MGPVGTLNGLCVVNVPFLRTSKFNYSEVHMLVVGLAIYHGEMQ